MGPRLILPSLIITLLLALGTIAAACGGDGGATQYDVTVRFNSSATQDDLFEVGALLRTYDDDLEYVIMEIFPPIGRAMLETDAADFCRGVEAQLEAKSYVDDVSCRPAVSGEPAGSPPANVSIAPNVFMTFEGTRYRAVEVLQASLIPQDEFQEIGVATDADGM